VVKAPRPTAHLRKLAECPSEVARCPAYARRLGDRLGLVLFQLSPGRSCDLLRLEVSPDSLPVAARAAFEFRDEGWLPDEAYCLPADRNAAVVGVSASRFADAAVSTSDAQYLPMHGDERTYASKYSDSTLSRRAERSADWRRRQHDAVVHFYSDARGYAVEDACALRAAVT
jgi:uncharacterized protein YecE (DUF72 family)